MLIDTNNLRLVGVKDRLLPGLTAAHNFDALPFTVLNKVSANTGTFVLVTIATAGQVFNIPSPCKHNILFFNYFSNIFE